jgi:hypothetical protein
MKQLLQRQIHNAEKEGEILDAKAAIVKGVRSASAT